MQTHISHRRGKPRRARRQDHRTGGIAECAVFGDAPRINPLRLLRQFASLLIRSAPAIQGKAHSHRHLAFAHHIANLDGGIDGATWRANDKRQVFRAYLLEHPAESRWRRSGNLTLGRNPLRTIRLAGGETVAHHNHPHGCLVNGQRCRRNLWLFRLCRKGLRKGQHQD